jgi:hypothetical protein
MSGFEDKDAAGSADDISGAVTPASVKMRAAEVDDEACLIESDLP